MAGNQDRWGKISGKTRVTQIFCMLSLILLSGSNLAQGAPSTDKQLPVEVTSERLDANYKEGKIRFSGKVVARQGAMTIYSDELILFLGQGDRQIKQIDALKNVRIEQDTRIATGQAARLDRTSGKIVMTGSPRVQEGEDFVEGDEITFFIDEDRSTVKSKAGSRVNAVFHPKEKVDAP